MNDIDSTFKLKEVLSSINVFLIDHLIVGLDNYFSFNDQGLILDSNE